jgi:hypothetical protein
VKPGIQGDELIVAEPHGGLVRRPRYFALDGTDHASRKEQVSAIRRYIIQRNSHARTNGYAE